MQNKTDILTLYRFGRVYKLNLFGVSCVNNNRLKYGLLLVIFSLIVCFLNNVFLCVMIKYSVLWFPKLTYRIVQSIVLLPLLFQNRYVGLLIELLITQKNSNTAPGKIYGRVQTRLVNIYNKRLCRKAGSIYCLFQFAV